MTTTPISSADVPDAGIVGMLSAFAPEPVDHGLALVVADRGNVWIGKAVTRGDWTHIEGARVVRRWGTSKGLNQLVSGPLPETKLDAPADLKVRTGAVIAIVPVEASAWSSV